MTTPGQLARRTERADAMQAGDIAIIVPTVTADDQVAKAVRVMAVSRLPGLIVDDEHLRPWTVLPVTRFCASRSPAPTRTTRRSPARSTKTTPTVSGWSSPTAPSATTRRDRPATVRVDATLLEVAALMARQHSPPVAVIDDTGALVGAITLDRLITSLAVYIADNWLVTSSSHLERDAHGRETADHGDHVACSASPHAKCRRRLTGPTDRDIPAITAQDQGEPSDS